MAKSRRKLSSHEMKHGSPSRSRGRRSDAALRDHIKHKTKASGPTFSSDRRTPWRKSDTSRLAALLDRGFDRATQRELLSAHRLLLARESYHENVQSALTLMYERTHHTRFKKVVALIEGPSHRHALLALSRKALEGTSYERTHALEAMARIEDEQACVVAWFIFERHGQQTRQRCARVIERCGSRRQLPRLEEEIANGHSRSSPATLEALEQARHTILERFPEDALLARHGSLTVLDEREGSRTGALSLEEHVEEGAERFDMVRSIDSLLDMQQERQDDPSLEPWRALQRFYALDDVSSDEHGAMVARHVPWHIQIFGGLVDDLSSWRSALVLFVLGCISPWLSAPILAIAWGYVLLLVFFWRDAHADLLRHGNVREAMLEKDKKDGSWRLDVLARVHGKPGKKPARKLPGPPRFMEEIAQRSGGSERVRVPVLLSSTEKERETQDLVLLPWNHDELTVSNEGTWQLTRRYHAACLAFWMVLSLLKLAWLLFSFLM